MQVLKELVAMQPLIRAQLGENTFCVTLHAITSALRKVSAAPRELGEDLERELGATPSKPSAARTDAWRPLRGQRLPAALRVRDTEGPSSRRMQSGVELGFCCATLDLDVALAGDVC
jgi:hypothetical protein